MKNIHVIENESAAIVPINFKKGEYKSVSWRLTEALAKSLVGGNIYFHAKQKSPSYFGGRITGINKVVVTNATGPHDRFDFFFTHDDNCNGIKIVGNWSSREYCVMDSNDYI